MIDAAGSMQHSSFILLLMNVYRVHRIMRTIHRRDDRRAICFDVIRVVKASLFFLRWII